MDVKVTAALLRVLKGCAATDVGQRVWVRLEAARGETIAVGRVEARFMRSWVRDSIARGAGSR